MSHPFTTWSVFRATEVAEALHSKKCEASFPDLKILVIDLFSALVSITGLLLELHCVCGRSA